MAKETTGAAASPASVMDDNENGMANRPLKGRHYHFIGSGGIGMSGLAKLLLQNGAEVTGSDQEDSAVVRHLNELGARITIGHHGENIRLPVDTVVISAAIREENPELRAARAHGCKVVKYAQMLGELMDRYAGIAVCGTHGKSTTSGWLSHLLTLAGRRPSYIVGADIPQLKSSSGVGKTGGLFVAEACEYDRSFLNLHPQVGVMLNIEQDHLDYYANEAEIVEAFADFSKNIRPGGVLVANGQDGNCRLVLRDLRPDIRKLTFGLEPSCDFYAQSLQLVDGLYRFDAHRSGRFLGRVTISIPGRHNVLNAMAVIAACVGAGIPFEEIAPHLGLFTGMDRRLMVKDQYAGITVIDDYAHHPTEIRASLLAIRQRFSPKRLWCVFQPHQYSRTRFLLDDFAESFMLADITIVPEIYFVRDTMESRQQINAEVLVDRICRQGCRAVFLNDFAAIGQALREQVQSGDVVVTMGAGTVWKVADEYLQWLRKNR